MLTCTKPFTNRHTTFTECCCLYGDAWGMDCALCPRKNTGIITQPFPMSTFHIYWCLLTSNFTVSSIFAVWLYGIHLLLYVDFRTWSDCPVIIFLHNPANIKKCTKKNRWKQNNFFITVIQNPTPICVISVSLVIPVGRMVRMLWLPAQFMSTRSALNTTARCPSMTIMNHQEVSKITHFR